MFEKYTDIITIDELQEMLRIGRNKAYDLLKSNFIKTARHGKNYIIPKKSVIDFIEQGCQTHKTED